MRQGGGALGPIKEQRTGRLARTRLLTAKPLGRARLSGINRSLGTGDGAQETQGRRRPRPLPYFLNVSRQLSACLPQVLRLGQAQVFMGLYPDAVGIRGPGVRERKHLPSQLLPLRSAPAPEQLPVERPIQDMGGPPKTPEAAPDEAGFSGATGWRRKLGGAALREPAP